MVITKLDPAYRLALLVLSHILMITYALDTALMTILLI